MSEEKIDKNVIFGISVTFFLHITQNYIFAI